LVEEAIAGAAEASPDGVALLLRRRAHLLPLVLQRLDPVGGVLPLGGRRRLGAAGVEVGERLGARGELLLALQILGALGGARVVVDAAGAAGAAGAGAGATVARSASIFSTSFSSRGTFAQRFQFSASRSSCSRAPRRSFALP